MKPAALDLAIATVPVGSLSPDPDNGRVHGRTLLEHDLVDKYRLTMDPVVVAAAITSSARAPCGRYGSPAKSQARAPF